MRGRKPAETDRAGSARAVVSGVLRAALALVATVASATGAAEEAPQPMDAASAIDSGLQLAVAMDEVVHVDELFTVKVALRNPYPEPVEVLIVHHRTRELPFLASFESTSGPYYSAALTRNDNKIRSVQSWDVVCGPDVPASERRGTFCPPTMNVYEIPAAGDRVFEEAVRLRDYEGVLGDLGGASLAFAPGLHRMEVWVSFIQNPTASMLDPRTRRPPFTRLETEVLFELETSAR